MKTNIRLVKKHRLFSEVFKRDLVKEYESGHLSITQLSRLHSIQRSLIYNWIYKYSTFNSKGYRIVEKSESSSEQVKRLQQKIKMMEQKVGKQQIEIDYLEQMILAAQEELDIDIKKNYSTLPSNDSGKKK